MELVPITPRDSPSWRSIKVAGRPSWVWKVTMESYGPIARMTWVSSFGKVFADWFTKEIQIINENQKQNQQKIVARSDTNNMLTCLTDACFFIFRIAIMKAEFQNRTDWPTGSETFVDWSEVILVASTARVHKCNAVSIISVVVPTTRGTWFTCHAHSYRVLALYP